jgi:hypothetical protein
MHVHGATHEGARLRRGPVEEGVDLRGRECERRGRDQRALASRVALGAIITTALGAILRRATDLQPLQLLRDCLAPARPRPRP